MGFEMMLGRHGGIKQRPLERPQVHEEQAMIWGGAFSFPKFNEKHRTIELKMVKIYYFFFTNSKYKLFQSFTLFFSPVCFVFPLELIFKNQTAIKTLRSRWWGAGWGLRVSRAPTTQAWVSDASAGTQSL